MLQLQASSLNAEDASQGSTLYSIIAYSFAATTASLLQVATQCNPIAWAWYRLLQTISDTLALGINYCEQKRINLTTASNAPMSQQQQQQSTAV